MRLLFTADIRQRLASLRVERNRLLFPVLLRADVDQLVVEVDVLPAKPGELADPHPGVEGKPEERYMPDEFTL